MQSDDEIDINAFLEARSAELQYLEQKIKTSTKKSLLHQRLPFHKRRRKRSENGHNNRISKKTKRKREFPYLRTHIWFAKRFRMLKMFNTQLPFFRNEKSEKFVYKSFDRGFVFDESFKRIYFLQLPECIHNDPHAFETQMMSISKTKYESFGNSSNTVVFFVDEESVNNAPTDLNETTGSIESPDKINMTGEIQGSFINSLNQHFRNEIPNTQQITETITATHHNEILKHIPNPGYFKRIYAKNESFQTANLEKNVFHSIAYLSDGNIEVFDVCLTNKYIIVVSMPSETISSLFSSHRLLKTHDCCLSLIQGTRNLLQTGVYKGFTLQKEDVDEFLDELILKQQKTKEFLIPYCFIKSSNNFEKGKILVDRKYLMNLWQFIFNKGIIPISLRELLRIGLETSSFVFPFDYIYSNYYKEFQNAYYKVNEEKYNRTPIAKRPNYGHFKCEDPFYVPEHVFDLKYEYLTKYFVAEKGSPTRMAVILDGDHVVGYVLRASFCFKRGKCAGVCIVHENSFKHELVCKNRNSDKTFLIEIIQND